MFDPYNRSLYLDNLQPPEGYRLECAIATTYSLDLMSLLMAPLSMIMCETQNKEEALRDPIALIEALQRSAGRVAVFCQQGKISIPKTDTRMYNYLEKSVVEARSPNRKGVFHPKLWILKFTQGKSTTYRLLCLSRNLTSDRSWDTVLYLEGKIKDHRLVNKENEPLRKFVNSLTDLSIYPVQPHVKNMIEQIVRDLKSVSFTKPENIHGVLEFIPLGIQGSSNKFSFNKSERSLIMSPFLSDNVLLQLEKHGKNNIIISTLDSLNKIDSEVLRRVQKRSKIYVFSDENEAQEDQGSDDHNGEQIENNLKSDDELLNGLHAKLYIIEKGENTNIYLGSANATDAGLNGKNTEILIGLTADRNSVSIDELFSFDDKDGIASMLKEYRRGRSIIKEDDTAQMLEKMLDELRELIIQTDLRVRISPDSVGSGYDIELTANSLPKKKEVLKSTRIYPVTLDKSYSRTFEDLYIDGKIVFSSVSIISIISFFAFEISAQHNGKNQRSSFVLNLPVNGIPPERDRAILQNIISDRGKFIRYILLLLTDENDPSRMMNMMARFRFGVDNSTAGAARNIPLLEELVKAYSRSPDKLKRINEIVRDLSLSDDKNDILPDGFDDVWEVFKQVLLEDRNNEK